MMQNVVTGDAAEQSYGWTKRLTAPVLNGGSVVIPAPDFDFEYTDIRNDKVMANGQVYDDGSGVTVTWKYIPPTMQLGQEATIVNNTGTPWPLGSDVYLFAPHLLAINDTTFDIKHAIYSIQQDIKDLTARVTTLEGGTSKA